MLPEICIHLEQEDLLKAIEFEDIIIHKNNPKENKLIFNQIENGDMIIYKLNEQNKEFFNRISEKILEQIEKHFSLFKVFVHYKKKNLFIYRASYYQSNNEPILALKTLFSTNLNYKEVKNYVLAIEEKEHFDCLISPLVSKSNSVKSKL